jgi:predicted amidohydrolase
VSLNKIAAAAAHFGRDLERSLAKAGAIIEDAHRQDVTLLVLPDATLGGYLGDLRHPDPAALPPSVRLDGPELQHLQSIARDMVVCIGLTERNGAGELHNTAVCFNGDGLLGTHRKVHQPLGESEVFGAGHTFEAFDTPIGRLGMMIDYDKTFPEAARSLALDGANVLACLSAWPASTTDRASSLPMDRQSRLFDLYDAARAAENQVVLVSSNQTGIMGGLRFLGQAKVVNPGGEVLARTSAKGGLAIAELDITAEVTRSRRLLRHLEERVLTSYRTTPSASFRATPDESLL